MSNEESVTVEMQTIKYGNHYLNIVLWYEEWISLTQDLDEDFHSMFQEWRVLWWGYNGLDKNNKL